MSYNFDEVIDRKNTNSLKYDFAVERGKSADILPLWVADMDFRAPKGVLDALTASVAHGIFGYSDVKEAYFEAVYNWYDTRYGWQPKEDWMVKTPGVVFAIVNAIRAFTKEGDSVLVQQPVYYPFMGSILNNGRRLVNNQLRYQNGKYTIDFKDFEEKIISENVKLFILCSPHNPVGRVWTKEELAQIGEICIKHNVLIVADEIHSDLIYDGYVHTVFTNISDSIADLTILCTAPSKTFNIAGLQVSNIFIPNESIRHEFKREMNRTGYSQLNTLGLVACKAAYETGASWLAELKEYLKGNLDFVRMFLKEKLPEIILIEPEGTYLVWLDFSRLNLDHNQLEDLIVNKAKLWLDAGSIFGPETPLFERINIACTRSTLEQALNQLEQAIRNY